MFDFQKKMYLFLSLVLFLFPSCIKYYKISNIEMHQGHDHEDERNALDGNKKTVAIYDQFMTQAIFDVLYLADPVRLAYVDKHCEKIGADLTTKKAMQAREIELNKNWISFYVLSDIRDKKHVSLTDKKSSWSIYLKFVDGATISPISIKEVDLEPEYIYLFGPMFNLFKRCYEVKFPARDLSRNFYIINEEPFQLFFSSAYKETALIFNEKDDSRELFAPKKKEKPEKIESVCKYCDIQINEEPTKKSRLSADSLIKERTPKIKRGPKVKKRKILKDEDFYWI
ncbi:MAG: hypothetical protein ABIF12_00480 [bacterium]